MLSNVNYSININKLVNFCCPLKNSIIKANRERILATKDDNIQSGTNSS